MTMVAAVQSASRLACGNVCVPNTPAAAIAAAGAAAVAADQRDPLAQFSARKKAPANEALTLEQLFALHRLPSSQR